MTEDFVTQIIDFFQHQNFWGWVGLISIAGFMLYLLKLLIYRSHEFPENLEEVRYYSGYPGLTEMKDGYLKVQGEELVFLSEEKKNLFQLPLKSIRSVSSEDVDQGKASLYLVGSTYGLAGSVQYVYVRYTDLAQKEQKLQFMCRSKSNKAERLAKHIGQYIHTAPDPKL